MTIPTAIDTQPAFRDGYEAYGRGATWEMNPYVLPSDRTKWRNGWLMAEREDNERIDQYEIDAHGDVWKAVDLVGDI